MVVGGLRQSRWTGKDGAPRARIEVMADRVQFLGPREAAPAEPAEAVAGALPSREPGEDGEAEEKF